MRAAGRGRTHPKAGVQVFTLLDHSSGKCTGPEGAAALSMVMSHHVSQAAVFTRLRVARVEVDVNQGVSQRGVVPCRAHSSRSEKCNEGTE